MRHLWHDLTPPFVWKLIHKSKEILSRSVASTVRRSPRSTGRSIEASGLDLYENDSCPDKRIFMHIHKCAGTSIYRTLAHYPGFVCCVARPGNFPYRLGREHIDDAVWNNSFKFTFVRNPFARMVSIFKMFKQSPHWAFAFSSFDDFVDTVRWFDTDGHQVEREIPRQRFAKRIDNIIHHCSSFHNPKYCIDDMDYIGRLETIRQDMQRIEKEFGGDRIALPKLNATAPDDYRSYYNARTRDLVAQKYHLDIERFGYAF